MINYYHRFMPGLANKLYPLYNATKEKTQDISWTPECQTAFEESKSALASATLLYHPNPSAKTSLTVDASDKAVGGQLEQYIDGMWRPIAFFSRKLSTAEQKYSTFDRELLSVYLAVKHFRHFVEGRSFTIYTDHKPLTSSFSSASERSPRQTRHLSFIAEFSTDIQHISGKQNVVADAFSRISAVALPSIDFHELALAQKNSDEIEAYRTSITGLVFEDIPFGEDTLLCDVSTKNVRPVVPKEWTKRIFDTIHGLSHSGCRPTQHAISSRFVWHNLKKDVRRWCRECHPCQASKIQHHVRAPLVERSPPDRRFGSLHVDIVGPLPPSEGMKYLFTVVDRFTRWPEAIPMADCTTETCVKSFIRYWISRFGVPCDVTSDRGPQFTSQLWKEMNQLLGISSTRTTAYHPQANGMVERFHRQLKAALKARLSGPNWMDELPIALLGIRSAWKEDSECSSADLVYGTNLHLPGEFFPSSNDLGTTNLSAQFLRDLQQKMRTVLPPSPKYHGKQPVNVPQNLNTAKFVYVRKDSHRTPLQRPYLGPFPVIEKNAKYFTVQINGKNETISIDRLKTAFTPLRGES
jgi:cleavage and polyadenylation specificity factor subunit 1